MSPGKEGLVTAFPDGLPECVDHLHSSTSRYDAAAKVMTLLLVCPTCGIERVVETLEYEPRPVWTSTGAVPRKLAA